MVKVLNDDGKQEGEHYAGLGYSMHMHIHVVFTELASSHVSYSDLWIDFQATLPSCLQLSWSGMEEFRLYPQIWTNSKILRDVEASGDLH
jgi:hypothetical protein